MTKETRRKNAVKRPHHLLPLEVQAISDARARGVKVSDLVKQYGVSCQSIYHTIRASMEMEAKPTSEESKNAGSAPPIKRRRSKRVSPEVEKAVADMKRKYPAWGVDYLREQWARAGNTLISRSSIYRILREAGLQTRQLVEIETFQRFEMLRPGQLWQMDIQGKIFLTGVVGRLLAILPGIPILY